MRTAILSVLLLMIPLLCEAKVLTIGIGQEGTNTVLRINGRICTPKRLSQLLVKLSSFSTDQQINVRADAGATATDLAQVLHFIQQAGLHSVVLIVPGIHNGKEGLYELSVDCAKRPLRGCISGVSHESGFRPSGEHDAPLEFDTEALDELDQPESSQQPLGPRSRGGPPIAPD